MITFDSGNGDGWWEDKRLELFKAYDDVKIKSEKQKLNKRYVYVLKENAI